jgi:hypothetical protein
MEAAFKPAFLTPAALIPVRFHAYLMMFSGGLQFVPDIIRPLTCRDTEISPLGAEAFFIHQGFNEVIKAVISLRDDPNLARHGISITDRARIARTLAAWLKA